MQWKKKYVHACMIPRILLTIYRGKNSFSEIKKEVDLSSSTISNYLVWIQVARLAEPEHLPKSNKKLWRLTEQGLNYLKTVYTGHVKTALDEGLVNRVELTVTPDGELYRRDDNIILRLTHVAVAPDGNTVEIPVEIDLGNDPAEVERFLDGLKRKLEALKGEQV